MSNHTMGKMTINQDMESPVLIFGGDGKPFMTRIRPKGHARPQEERDANARRLVACWNLCDGIPTEQIEGMDLGRLLAERGELMEALKEAREELRLVRMKDGAVYDPTLCVRIDTIIAKCEGKS